MKELFKALAAFQQEVPVIHKGTSGYGYSYADLSEILSVVNPILKKHGLGFTQPMKGTKLKTIVFHVDSGESIESEVDIPQNVTLKGMNEFQSAGSGITYYRRYSLASTLGLVTDIDNDANPKSVEANFQKKNGRPLPKTQPKANFEAVQSKANGQVAKLAQERRKTLVGLYRKLQVPEGEIQVKLRTVKSIKAADELIKKLEDFTAKKEAEKNAKTQHATKKTGVDTKKPTDAKKESTKEGSK